MRVAVTGGAGFIGEATIRHLEAAGHDAWSFDHTQGNDVLGSLQGLRSAEAVIHLAGMLGTAELFDDAERAVEVNVIGALRILQWCENARARYIGITMPPVFPSVYTATKICADRLATAWHLSRGVPVSRVRAYNAYGPGQKHGRGHPQKILPTFAVHAWEGRPIPIWGDGEQTVDMVHADDVGRMLADAINHGDDAVFDAGTGVEMSVNEVAELVIEVTGSKAGIDYQPMRDGEVPTRIVAEGYGWERLTWKPMHDLDRMAEAIESYK